MLGVVYLFFSAIALLASVYHLLYWPRIHDQISSLTISAEYGADYLKMPSEFWGSLMLGLCLCLMFEGIVKVRRAAQ